MALNDKNSNISVNVSMFDKNIGKDVVNYHIQENVWTHARNAINNSITGDLESIGNEPSNSLCIKIDSASGMQIIGAIYLFDDRWIIFSTNRKYPGETGFFTHEIGYFNKLECCYVPIYRERAASNSSCLNFAQTNLIYGVSRYTQKCTYKIYWDDGLNPTRTMDVGNPDTFPKCDVAWDPTQNAWTDENNYSLPYQTKQDPSCSGDCDVRILDKPLKLECDKIRLAPKITAPCIRLSKSKFAGTLLNGQYAVCVAYTINRQKISDYFISLPISIFSHSNVSGSIDVEISGLDTDEFDEIQVVVLSQVSFKPVAKVLGYYSTSSSSGGTMRITIDAIDNSLPDVPLQVLPLSNPIFEKSDYLTSVNGYLMRINPTGKLDFNYQPLANRIITEWVLVEYPEDYYIKGGTNIGYLRDEVYTFFIRWIYDTGDRSPSFFIPGRPMRKGIDDVASTHYLQNCDGNMNVKWFCENTAIVNWTGTSVIPDDPFGGKVIAKGYCGYYESSEKIDSKHPERWNTFRNCNKWIDNVMIKNGDLKCLEKKSIYNIGEDINDYDLCGKHIRLHKMPDETIDNALTLKIHDNPSKKIRILGVSFKNILPPIDNDGNIIKGIIGYEILRGSRDGNRTIIAKGIINNVGTYTFNNTLYGFANYPYNDIHDNVFLAKKSLPRNRNLYKFSLTNLLFNLFYKSSLEGDYFAYASTYKDNYYDDPNNPFTSSDYSENILTFHSPETTFQKPYLSAKEMKIYAFAYGISSRYISKVEDHPKYKLISDFALQFAAIISLGHVAAKIEGDIELEAGHSIIGNIQSGFAFAGPAGIGANAGYYANLGISPATLALLIGNIALLSPGLVLTFTAMTGLTVVDFLLGYSAVSAVLSATSTATGAGLYVTPKYKAIPSAYGKLPLLIRQGAFPIFFMFYMSEAIEEYIRLFRNMTAYKDYAAKFLSHGLYDDFKKIPQPLKSTKIRTCIKDAIYLGDSMVHFNSANITINNKFRTDKVALYIDDGIDKNLILTEDESRWNIDILNPGEKAILGKVSAKYRDNYSYEDAFYKIIQRKIGSYYVGLKQNIRNAYGQLDNIKQIPIGCINKIQLNTCQAVSSNILFGGDIYINRYTERDVFFYFYDWPRGMPDGTEWDYRNTIMGLYPRYWINSNINISFDDISNSFGMDVTSNPFETLYNIISFLWNSTLVGSIINTILGALNLGGSGSTGSSNNFVSSLAKTLLPYNLDGDIGRKILSLGVYNGFFYLYDASVRDFWVESEINLAFRDHGEQDSEQAYIPYVNENLKSLFDDKIIKLRDYFKYDFSLSASRFFTNTVSWSYLQPHDYNPFIAESCYTKLWMTVIYSLPQSNEHKKDYWSIFLPNNYKRFNDNIVSIRELRGTGLIMLFENSSPLLYNGVDTLQTDNFVKITIGDGGLFTQPPQSIVNVDREYEYGSCQNRLSFINTPYGSFYISADQDKVFWLANGLNEISNLGMRWWFSNYCRYRILEDFPTFDLLDNPVIGVGMLVVYDNTNGLVYFCKRDYKLKDSFVGGNNSYDGNGTFTINGVSGITVKDSNYFEDAGWTVSYDPKIKGFVSFHDWHPDLTLGSQDTFCTIKGNGIWTHNTNFQSYCNYYGIQYPFEIGYIINNKVEEITLKSIEYYLEVYKYDTNGYDRFHILDENFDRLVISTTEQCSGMLRFNLHNKTNPIANNDYPKFLPGIVDILYSKEENRYRINMFYDLVKDRGEFSGAQNVIWNTSENGYVKTLNPLSLDYSKPATQRKRIRNYKVEVLFIKTNPADKKFIFNLALSKLNISKR